MIDCTCDLSVVVELLSTHSVVDSPAADQSSEILGVDSVDIVALDQPGGETADVSQTLQLPDGTVALIKNIPPRQYQYISAVRIVFFKFRIESNSYPSSQKSPVVSTC